MNRGAKGGQGRLSFKGVAIISLVQVWKRADLRVRAVV